MRIKSAIYIKLGESGGWEKDSIDNNRIRLGWKNIPLDLIKNKNWNKIKILVEQDFINRGKKTGSTNDFNALFNICNATNETVFITFYSGKMYWCTPKQEQIYEDDISKYIKTEINWTCQNIINTRTFEINQISGRLTKLQLFMGTSCKVKNDLNEFDYLKTIIEGKESKEYLELMSARNRMKEALIPAIRNFTPKDFEVLIDLVFRNSGWKRTSVLGEVMKFFDLILEEPFSKKLHGVQIKSKSTFNTFSAYSNEFLNQYTNEFDTFFFVVHTPDPKLEAYESKNEKIKILKVPEIADLSIDAGLVSWIMEKAR